MRDDIEGRDLFSKTFNHHTCPHLGTTLLFLVPAFLYLSSCTSVPAPVNQEVMITTNDSRPCPSATEDCGTADLHIFTYNDDPLKRLDAYQHYTDPDPANIKISSRSGRKTVLLCANSQRDSFSWQEIQSLYHLDRLSFPLENEDPERPLSSGLLHLEAGEQRKGLRHELTPFLSRIELHTLRVDFSGTSYRGSPLTDIKIYLTNVNGEVTLLEKDFSRPVRYMNHRKLDQDGLQRFKHPEMLFQKIGNIPDLRTCWPQVSLHCFPNTCATEDMGTSFTRLVIEGKINGKTYYYPIPIGRRLSRVPFPRAATDKEPPGIQRNCRYVYEVTIRRTGSTDPDTPVDFGTVETALNIEPWKEKPAYSISF